VSVTTTLVLTVERQAAQPGIAVDRFAREIVAFWV